MEINKKEAIEYLEEGIDILVVVGDSKFVIGDMHNYVGAPEDEVGYISEYLGNVWYSSAERVIDETIRGMADNNTELINKARFFIE